MQGKAIVLLLEDIFDKTKDITPEPTAAPISSGTGLDGFLQLVGLVFLLVVILVATYFTTRFVGGIKQNQLKNSNFKVIDAYRISPNKVVQILKIGNKYIVLGISKDAINYITELEEAEVFTKEINSGEKLSFKQILDKMRNKK